MLSDSYKCELISFSGFASKTHKETIERGLWKLTRDSNGRPKSVPVIEREFDGGQDFFDSYAMIYAQEVREMFLAKHGVDVPGIGILESIEKAEDGISDGKIFVSLSLSDLKAIRHAMIDNSDKFWQATYQRYPQKENNWIPLKPYDMEICWPSSPTTWDPRKLGILLQGLAGGGWSDLEIVDSDRFKAKLSDIIKDNLTPRGRKLLEVYNRTMDYDRSPQMG